MSDPTYLADLLGPQVYDNAGTAVARHKNWEFMGAVTAAESGSRVRITVGGVMYAVTSTAWAPGTIAAGARETLKINVTGAVSTDLVVVNRIGATPVELGLVLQAHVSADDEVALTLDNLTGSGVAAASATYRVMVLRAAS